MAADVADPTVLYRVRDGVYAADLLIAALADVDLFSWLASRGPVTAAQLCAVLGLAERPTDVLLTYCAALGVIDRAVQDDDRVVLTDLGRQHLTADSPFDLRSYFLSLAERPAVRELARVLRTDEPASWASAASTGTGQTDWSGRLDEVEFARRITAAMDSRGAFLGPALAEAISDLPVRALLDVAEGSGVYAGGVLDRHPGARAAVFEQSPVDAAARTLLATRGGSDRVEVITGDMFTDPLPAGFDVHLFSHVLHDWDAVRVEQQLAASFEGLTPGGWLVDHDTHLDADKRGPLPIAEYSVFADALHSGQVLVDRGTGHHREPGRLRRHRTPARRRRPERAVRAQAGMT